MDLKKIFSGRVIGLIVFIFVVLFLGAAFNVKLEGMEEKKKESMEPKMKEGNAPNCKEGEHYDEKQKKCVK